MLSKTKINCSFIQVGDRQDMKAMRKIIKHNSKVNIWEKIYSAGLTD